MERLFSHGDLEILRQWDTPTLCNALAVLAPERRAVGFTVEPLMCLDPKLPPMVGLARVGTVRAREAARGQVADRADWYEYVADADLPTIVVLQDVDDRPGFGAFWGEVDATIHRALGALGCVTNGGFRDVSAWPEGFQMLGGRIGPSQAHVHLVDFGTEVDVCGMRAAHDDVIHADVHGACVIPAGCVRGLPDAIDLVVRREAVVMEVCRRKDFSAASLRDALKRSEQLR